MGNLRTYLSNNKHLYLPALIPSLLVLYLAAMSVREYSWVFVGSDGGDWLASATRWMVPQPYGAPVYITLSHIISWLFPSILPWAMSTLLGALPTAITAYFSFLAIRHITHSSFISATGAALIGGSAILLTQSTTIGYHALGVMFLTIAFYQYLLGNRYRVAILLALGLGVHIMILPIAVFWLVVEIVAATQSHSWMELKSWLKPTGLFLLLTIGLYSVILLLMYLPTPRYMAGSLSISSALVYWTKTSQAIVGEISIFETSGRLVFWFKLLFMCFGVALIPLWLAFKRPVPKYVFILLGTIVFVMWYFVTCLDVLTWTYISFATPSIIILACIGLSRLNRVHTKLVLAYSLVILVLNPLFMNANLLTQAKPQGNELLQELSMLPSTAIVVVDPGAEGFGVIYYAFSHPERILVPLLDENIDNPQFYSHDYTSYLESTYHLGLNYANTLTAIQSALDKGIAVYYADYSSQSYEQSFNLIETGNIKRITSLTGLPRKPAIIWSNKW